LLSLELDDAVCNFFYGMVYLQAFDTEECMTWVDRGEASLLGLDAGEVYVAGRYHSLVPILQEVSHTLTLDHCTYQK
jgi:hypothetical protein